MNPITLRQLPTAVNALQIRSKSMWDSKLDSSFETAESLISLIQEFISGVLSTQITEENFDAITQVALTLIQDMRTLEKSAKDITSECDDIASKLRNMEPSRPQTPKTKFSLSRKKVEESKKSRPSSNSCETLNEDKHNGVRSVKDFPQDGSAGSLGSMVDEMRSLWNTVSVEIDQLDIWTDTRLVHGVNQHLPEMYELSTTAPRLKLEALLDRLRRYITISPGVAI